METQIHQKRYVMFNWERIWRTIGIGFAVLFIITYVIYGSQPKVGASAVELSSFYDGNRTRILMANVLLALQSCSCCGSQRRSRA